MADSADIDHYWMGQAIELATKGEGSVEPNPMVGCILVKNGKKIGVGYHRRFGEAHAEVAALQYAEANSCNVTGATAYVTLEPCSHVGKTGPCADRLIEAKVARVVIGMADPFVEVSGQGISKIKDAGIEVVVGIDKPKCTAINAPYLKCLEKSQPWIIAKWAMTLDGKIATRTGESQWISSEKSRQEVQILRGRVDGIMVGINTVLADDPMLNARPDDPTMVKRIATRIVLDSRLRLPLDSRLVKSAHEYPVLIGCGPQASAEKAEAIRKAGCEVWQHEATDASERLGHFLTELGKRGMTNVLVEGGGELLGSLHDRDCIDEIHLFLGPKLFGNSESIGPIGGRGHDRVDLASEFEIAGSAILENDLSVVYRKQPRR